MEPINSNMESSMKALPQRTLQLLAAVVLIAMIAVPVWAAKPAPKPLLEKAKVDTNRPILFDSDPVPPYYPDVNPYNVLASMNCWTTPVLDHNGKPHHNGHLIQIIMDGGNGKQDPPNADGTPGGDDSLAYGNFNMQRLLGIEEPPRMDTATGMFYSVRYFIPFEPGRAYYLRLWEGDNVATAPYYQDTIEYDAGEDRGGAMIMLTIQHPIDVDWKFGPSKPRPKG
jgi:hypothetical protein